MSNPNGYQGGGAEYGAPQYAPQQPTMRPVGSQPAPAYDAGADPWGKAAAPSAPAAPPSQAASAAAALAVAGDDAVYLSRAYQAHGEEVRGAVRIPFPRGAVAGLARWDGVQSHSRVGVKADRCALLTATPALHR